MIYVENLNINSCQKSGTSISGDIPSITSTENGNTLPHFSDEGAFNRSVRPSPSSYNPHLPLSLMPPTSSSSAGAHDASARSNSLSSVSGESANDTELSCTTPSPSASSNTLSIFNANQSQVQIYKSLYLKRVNKFFLHQKCSI